MNDTDALDPWQQIFTAAAARYHSRSSAYPRTRPRAPRLDDSTLFWARDVARELEFVVDPTGITVTGIGPIPVEEIATILGFRIVAVQQWVDGHLPSPHSGEIYVRQGVAAARTRFTIGHELGHVWLGRRPEQETDPRLRNPKAVEAFCDAVSAQLLLPDRFLNALPPRPDYRAAKTLAHTTGVSVPVVFNRAFVAKRWRCLLVDWELRGHQWHTVAHAGGPWDPAAWTLADEDLAVARHGGGATVTALQRGRTRVRLWLQVCSHTRHRMTSVVWVPREERT